MKKKIILAALCSAGLLAGCNETADKAAAEAASDAGRSATLPAKTEDASPTMDTETLLTVNGTPVTRTMYSLYFQDRMRNVPDAKNSPELQMSVLNELSNILIVAQDAEEKGLHERTDVAASIDLLKAKLLTQIAIQEHANANKPTDEQLQQVYDTEYTGQSNTEYKARHILLKEEDQAKSIIAKLADGADFAELAKQHSTGPTGKSGGDLGWFDAAQMVKPFGDALKGMEKGKYSAAPIQTQFGWHVILLEDSRETAAPTLESVRSKIMTGLQQKSLAEYMQGLRDSSNLVFNEQNAKPAAQTAAGEPAAEASNEQAMEATATTEKASGEQPAPEMPAADTAATEKSAEEMKAAGE
ncbi:MAG: peptidylprolyl isomerase [Candidatus Thiodiazotropha sp. (ex Epidulcina cf. delphinae)]|nr:peptidylprolyl isomerase [Candidatus Thiodiazotropha sp. (ex Epidulcina cf. delphinae)]